MRHINVHTSPNPEPRGAAVLTTAFAVLAIAIGALAVSAAATAAPDGPPTLPPPAGVSATPSVEVEARPPAAALETTASPNAATDTDAAPITPENVLAEPEQNSEPTAPDTPEPLAAAPIGLTRIDVDPLPAPPVKVVFGLGDTPTGCAAGCITNVSVEQIAAGSPDMVMSVQTDTPAEVIVAMMALDQGDDPVGGDPYAASHGLVTEWTIELVDLLPGTTYEYAVIAIDEQGGTDTYTTAMQLTDKITTKIPVEMCTFRCGGPQGIAIHAQQG